MSTKNTKTAAEIVASLKRHEIDDATITTTAAASVRWSNYGVPDVEETFKRGEVLDLQGWRPEGVMIRAKGHAEVFASWRDLEALTAENTNTGAAEVAAYISESVATATAEAQRKGAQNQEDAWRVLESEPVREVLRKFDGKQINKRLFDAMAVACGDTPHDYQFGGHSYGDLSSVKLDGRAFDDKNRRYASCSGLSVNQPEFMRKFVNSRGYECHACVTLVCRADDFKRLDTAATLDDLQKRAANARRYIRQDFMAADATPEAVRRVNEIAEKARELLDFCEVATKSEEEKTYNGAISVLCELSEKIYDAISSFKYDAHTRHGKEGR